MIKGKGFKISLCLLYFSGLYFLIYFPLNPDLLRELRKLDIFYIIYCYTVIFPICQVFQKKEPEDTLKEMMVLQLQVVLMPLLLI